MGNTGKIHNVGWRNIKLISLKTHKNIVNGVIVGWNGGAMGSVDTSVR